MWASTSKWPKPSTPSTPTPTRSPLEPGSPSSRGRRGQGETNPLPLPLPRPLLYPLPTATRTPATQCPPGQKEWRGRGRNWAGGKGRTKEGNRTGRPRSPKTVQSAEGEEGKEKRERIIVVVRSPCQENYPADAHPSAHKSVLESANPAWTRSVHLDTPGQRHGQQPVSGTAGPGVVKQDKSSRASVDTTKTRSGPQRVRMSSGERPIGAAKGKQSDTEALCQTPPSLPSDVRFHFSHQIASSFILAPFQVMCRLSGCNPVALGGWRCQTRLIYQRFHLHLRLAQLSLV